MHQKTLWQVYSILMLNILVKGIGGCSTFCACKWKNGKQTVECSNKSLIEIPDGMDPETQVLEFSGNNLNALQKELFWKKQIINLQRIYLSHCQIKSIHSDAFKGLTNLVELDLSNNLLDSVPTAAFINCPSLMKLTLSFNRIKTLQKFSFNHLSYLNTLELDNCKISQVEEGAFQGLHSLEWLHLDGNRLKTIRGRRTLPENVKGVELQKNAWECDCHIQDLFAWLQDFTVPLSVEPVCNGPPRLAGRAIKSIPAAELACLPDISPTTFYLELGEGKNVSLLCHVHAIPEATVSWWFQGQMLQNNTMVAPGVNLIYFVEEGSENKRSELFIYNATAEGNGTFICNAENAAGTSQSNFTIKIVLKEEPIVIIVSFPFEYFLCAVIGVSVLALVILILFTILIWKCCRKRNRRRRQEKDKHKDQYQQNPNKCSLVRENSNFDEASVLSPDPLTIPANCDDGLMAAAAAAAFAAHPCEELYMSPVVGTNGNQLGSPSSLRRYHLEQNPDLINGTESIPCRREVGDGEDDRRIQETFDNPPIACLRGSREFYKDLRCIVQDAEGYPLDYGLPKIPTQSKENYYRTLPNQKRLQRHSAANPINRFSREAEFLSRSMDSSGTQYDHYHTDVRYTADGYPARVEVEAPSSLPCCSVQWPACVPANLHTTTANCSVTKRCVGAQTDTQSAAGPDNLAPSKIDSNVVVVVSSQNDIVNEVLTESPDEGYEGEPSVV